MTDRHDAAASEVTGALGAECPSLDALEGSLEVLLHSRRPRDDAHAAAVESIRSHLHGCPACRTRLDEMRQANAFIGRFTEVLGERSPMTDGESADTTDPARNATVPDAFPGYRMHDVLAVGGQGMVYRAEQLATGRIVAIKVPVGDAVRRPAKRFRFRREVELTARLRHPGIVDVFGGCEAPDGRIGCVMEYVNGVRFDDWAAVQRVAGRAGVRRIVVAVRKIAEAIAHAHQNAVLHRDIKPSNVIVTADGAPRVLDFGLAKAIDDGTASFATVTGAFVGTLAFAAPEQVMEGRETTDVRTDVHGLGLLLYLALAGSVPWDVDGPTEDLLSGIRDRVPMRPTRDHHAPDSELDAIVLMAMAKEKSRRYQSAAEFADDLARWLDGAAVRARFDSRWYVVRKTLWRQRRVALVTASVVVAAIAIAALGMESRALRLRETVERERANGEALRTRAIAEVMRGMAPRGDLTQGNEVSRQMVDGLRRLAGRLELGLYADDPEYEAALRITVGSLVSSTPSMAGDGEVYVRNALASRIGAYGPDHPEVATGQHDLAIVLLHRSRDAEAMKSATRAVELRQRHHGAEHWRTRESLELSARIRMRLDDRAGAATDARAAQGEDLSEVPPALRVAIRRTLAETAAPEESGPAWTVALDAFSDALAHLADDDLLVPQTLATLARLAPSRVGPLPDFADGLGVTDWSQLSARLNLIGQRLATPRDADQSQLLKAREDLLAIRQQLLGAEHRSLGLAHACVGLQHYAAMRWAPAIEHLEKALPILRRTLGDTHLAIANCHERLSGCYLHCAEMDRVISNTKAAMSILEAQPSMGRDELTIAVAYGYLARYENFAGQFDAALRSSEEAIRRLEPIVGPSHHAHAFARCVAAWSLSELERHEEAVAMARAAWNDVAASPATPTDQLLFAEVLHGFVLSRGGVANEGQKHLKSSLLVLIPHFDVSTRWRGLDCFFDELVESCRRSGEIAEVETLLRWRAALSPLSVSTRPGWDNFPRRQPLAIGVGHSSSGTSQPDSVSPDRELRAGAGAQ